MSKSWKSRGRGGLPRHIALRPARRSHGRAHYSAKQRPAGTFGIGADESPSVPPPALAATPVPKSDDPLPKGWVSLDALKEAIVRPGIERHLQPLLLYRGYQSIGRIKMLWNHVLFMHLAGAQDTSAGVKLHQDPDLCHLLGPPNRFSRMSLDSFLSRMLDHIGVASNIPGLPGYLKDELAFRRFNLTRISDADPRSKMDFRREAGRKLWAENATRRRIARDADARSQDLFYPYMIHDPRDNQADLVMFINRVIPRGLTPDLRADVCQEMLLAVLTGEISRDQAHGKRYEIIKRVMRMNDTQTTGRSVGAGRLGPAPFCGLRQAHASPPR